MAPVSLHGRCSVQGQRSPVTDYFFWPRRDAWEELKASLESKTWIGERDRVLLLNQTTEVINYWQEGEKKMLDQARQAFPDAKFQVGALVHTRAGVEGRAWGTRCELMCGVG